MFSKVKKWILLYFQGTMMGVADLVPGVSGGTIAFILGLHPDLLKSLKTLRLSSVRHPKSVAWFLLTAIGLGILSSLIIGSHAIYFLLNHGIYQGLLRALFMGLIIGSIYFCIQQVSSWNIKRAALLLAGAMIAFTVSYISTKYSTEPQYDVPMEINAPDTVLHEAANYDYQKKLLKNVKWSNLKALYEDSFIDSDTWIFSHDYNRLLQVESCLENRPYSSFHLKLGLCGMLSIGAMILPGISGNQVMQLMGCYETIIEAIAFWTSGLKEGSFFNPSFWVLFSVGIGILVGIMLFSRVLIFFYQKYFLATLSLLIGFMIGSLPNLWPFWKVTYHIKLLKDRYHLSLQRLNPELPSLTSFETGLALTMLLLGVGIIIAFERKLAFKKLQMSEK